MSTTSRERRLEPRAAVKLALTLGRGSGSPIVASTLDLAPNGSLIACQRPLGIDELLAFDLPLGEDGPHVTGRARVLRQRTDHIYALRFERISGDTRGKLERFVAHELASH